MNGYLPRLWTEAEEAEVIRLVALKWSMARIALKLKRSVNSVTSKGRDLRRGATMPRKSVEPGQEVAVYRPINDRPELHLRLLLEQGGFSWKVARGRAA